MKNKTCSDCFAFESRLQSVKDNNIKNDYFYCNARFRGRMIKRTVSVVEESLLFTKYRKTSMSNNYGLSKSFRTKTVGAPF